MVQDHEVLHRCSTSTSKSNKKPKKEPQRGLGVAQLERLRLEEQRKANNINALNSSATASASASVMSFHSSLPHHQPFVHQVTPPSSPAIWQCHNLASYWRHQQLPQASVPPLMSSGYVPWLEPPSNQILCSSHSNSSLLSLGDAKDISGMKRAPPLPFSLDYLANPFSSKVPTVSGLVKVNGSLPFGNDSFGFGAATATFSASCKTIQREYNETCDGDFLTLGVTNSNYLPYSKQIPSDQQTPPAAYHLCRESNDVSYIVSNSEVSRNLAESQNFYNFLPMSPSSSEKTPQEQLPPVPDDLDLNLKL